MHLYQQAMTEDRTRAEADFIQAVCGVPPAARLLDVPSGNGRPSLELALRGYEMTAVDISQEFVDEALAKAAQRGLNIACERRDMWDLPWQEEFDGAFCFGNSFGFFEDTGNADLLVAVARTLTPNGRFILDLFDIAEIALPKIQERVWWPVGDTLFLVESRYDHPEGRIHREFTFVREGKAEKRSASFRVYTYREVCRLLEEAGFARTEAFSSLSKEPFALGASRLLLLATKRGE